ncbi:cytochrome c oxidase assembly factor Coa1 family protein [Dyella silvatica]|uniref:cytochrome c oxidase assembly factor Coa1 family protein n=1 Tax=Dyella silvatica TaxID=2992128 RepID=UPI00225C3783|nr:cytochrome c oxidase assembly factor Coa1 family protein [Dyella silvatica]
MNANAQPNWYSRNWKWFVPVLCVSIVVLLGAAMFGVISLVFGMMKSSDAYQQAVIRASANPAVVAALGQPITTGYFTTGSIQTSNDNGAAQLAIPLKGSKGEATVYLVAKENAGHWTYSTLTVSIASTKQQIDLLQEGSDSH